MVTYSSRYTDGDLPVERANNRIPNPSYIVRGPFHLFKQVKYKLALHTKVKGCQLKYTINLCISKVWHLELHRSTLIG